MKRRTFLAGVGAGAAAVAMGRMAAAAEGMERPNILVLSTEDISPNLGCYGDAYASTPNLDAFAAQGVRYTNTYGVIGVCAPNRSCLISGVYPPSLGSHDMRSTTRLPESIRCFSQYLREAGYYCTNNAKTDYNFAVPKEAWDECGRKGHYRNRKPGQPFFAVFNTETTHESRIRIAPEAMAKLTARLTPQQRHDPAKAPLPPYHPDAPEVRRDWANYHDLISAMDYEIADRLKELEEAGLAENTIVIFFGDNGAGMPGCKKWSWESGLRVPMIIRFPKKHASLAPGKAGSVCERMVSFVDFAPTMLSLAGVRIPGHMQGTAFLGAAAGRARTYVHGHRDGMAERFETVRTVRDARFQYVRNFQPHLTWAQYVSYTEQMPTMQVWRKLANEGKLTGAAARYFSPRKPVEELYDTANDPHQVKNLAGEARYRADLERLRAECVRWMKEIGDLGLLPAYEVAKRAEGKTPWEVGHDAKRNPVEDLLRAAEVANAMDGARVPELVTMLKSPEAGVRFWGALGLVALKEGARAAGEALAGAMRDEAPDVRVVAAEAMCNIGRETEGMKSLLEALRHPTPFVRLRAMNVLDRMGEKARPVLGEIRTAPMKCREHPHVAEYVGRMVEDMVEKMERRGGRY